MKLHLVKRVGMLAACAAAATVCAFGVASLNGLRYVRPTAENWTLLAYIEPAARVEQQVERLEVFAFVVAFEALLPGLHADLALRGADRGSDVCVCGFHGFGTLCGFISLR